MTHPAFEHLRSHYIPSLHTTVEEYRHRHTGARHYHLAAQNAENVFLVALRTVPEDSTGVAHILEHTALCGSERYPVRDPFFMMTRRSLNTFMNAFTSSDWTAYPFASQNRKDFDNLLQVYLDAVFFSRLDPLDFAQEGHRLEFERADDPSSPLQFKGVVFNEMKGAMSSVNSTLWHTLCKYLFPSNTYHYNSGGDPEHIPDLSYQQLVDFYRSHYHPSNAIFMTCGDIPAAEHQARFEALALSRFEPLHEQIRVAPEKRYHAPVRVEEAYAFTQEGSTEQQTHIVLGWLLGKSTDLLQHLRAQLLNMVLLDNSASPLRQALETTGLGRSPSALCGLEDSHLELAFVCGLEGSEPDRADAVEALVLDTLKRVAQHGVPREQVEAMLHQLELHQREITGDGYPYGLQLILASLPAATHGGDPVALLDIEPVLEQLRRDIQDDAFIPGLVRQLLLDNPHRVRLSLRPDTQLAARRDAAEAARLAEIKDGLSPAEAERIVAQAAALEARQLAEPDPGSLPKVGIEDVPADQPVPAFQGASVNGTPATFYPQGTNGLVYQQIVMPMPHLDDDELMLLPYYTQLLTEVGVGERDYLATQAWQASVCGGLSAFSSARGNVDDEQAVTSFLTLSSKALARNSAAMGELVLKTLEQARFDELPRLRELIAQIRARRQNAVTGSGHSLAMLAASRGMSPAAALSHKLSGLAGIRHSKQLDDSLAEAHALQQLGQRLQQLHAKVLAAPRQLLLVAEDERRDGLLAELNGLWPAGAAAASFNPLALPPTRQQVRELWVANTQVNFCAKAYPTVTVGHPDAPALTVLGGFLKNGFLHRAVREQGGAYGGGAGQDSNTAAFRFYSYRDPRLQDTLADFDAAVQWCLQERHSADALEEAILGVIASLDKPSSPAGEAKQDFHNRLFGRTPEQRKQFRSAVLRVSLDDLQRVTGQYLQPSQASIAVITSRSSADGVAGWAQAEGLVQEQV